MRPSKSLPVPHTSTRRLLRSFAGTAAVTILACGTAHAAGSGMPWEQPLQQILDSVQGPVAKIIAVIIIIVTGVAATLVLTALVLAGRTMAIGGPTWPVSITITATVSYRIARRRRR